MSSRWARGCQLRFAADGATVFRGDIVLRACVELLSLHGSSNALAPMRDACGRRNERQICSAAASPGASPPLSRGVWGGEASARDEGAVQLSVVCRTAPSQADRDFTPHCALRLRTLCQRSSSSLAVAASALLDAT